MSQADLHRQSSVSLIFSYSAHAVFPIFPVLFAGSQAKPFVSCDIGFRFYVRFRIDLDW